MSDAAPLPSQDFKEQGNAEYKKGQYLKAAALYTKALKEAPASAALYSNRSAALTQLNKLDKAVKDADECIRLEPEWDKGYFRKGAALEAFGKLDEALDAYEQAAAKGEGNNTQAQAKVRNMQKLLQQRRKKVSGSAAAVDNTAAV